MSSTSEGEFTRRVSLLLSHTVARKCITGTKGSFGDIRASVIAAAPFCLLCKISFLGKG